MRAKHVKFKTTPKYLKRCVGKSLIRAAAFLAVVSMAMSMSVSAFAAEYWIGDGDITVEVDKNGNHYVTQVDKGGNKKYDNVLDTDGNVTIKGGSSQASNKTLTQADDTREDDGLEDFSFGVDAEEEVDDNAAGDVTEETNTEESPEETTDEAEETSDEENEPEQSEEENAEEPAKNTEQEEQAADEENAEVEERPVETAAAAERNDAAEPQADAPDKDDFFGYVIKIISNAVAKVTLDNVKIDVSNQDKAAMTIEGDGDIELELDGKNELRSGGYSAGLEKNDDISEGNLIINDKDNNGELTALGGFQSAGIGGGQDKNSSNIIINGGTIVAKGGYEGHWGGSGAGIGGGGAINRNSNRGNGSNITINGGNITATGGGFAAGIGGGCFGDGSNITVNGGIVNAASNIAGAGIGGGDAGGNGNNITITGGTVTATGKSGGAGIGGGPSGNGKDIAISGGTVTAIGGESGGAGIGGGANGNGSNITISGDVQITVEVKQGFDIEGNATAGTIGSGTKGLGSGEEIQPDIFGLYTNGYIHHIIYDTDGVTIIKEWWEYGTVTPPAPEDETADTETFPLHVDDLFGNTLSYTTTRDGATLTVTVGDAFARLHGTLSALEELRAQGVETIVFATAMQTTTVSVADLLAQNSPDTEFAVEHVGVISRVLVGGDAVALACQQR